MYSEEKDLSTIEFDNGTHIEFVAMYCCEIIIRSLVQYICFDTGVSAANSGFHDSSVEWLELAMHKYSESRQVQVKILPGN